MRTPYLIISLLILVLSCSLPTKDKPTPSKEIFQTNIFSPIHTHTHGATIVALPNGDLLAAWFQGSGERWADDVGILGSRLLRGDTIWSSPFVMADVEGFPDVNPALFLDGQKRLWLAWYTVMANLWETSLPKYRISSDYMMKEGVPNWEWQEVLHVKPGGPTERGIQADDGFAAEVQRQMDNYEPYLKDTLAANDVVWEGWKQWRVQKYAYGAGETLRYPGYVYDEEGNRSRKILGYPLFRRIGWQTKNKAVMVDGKRLILPLYSDGLGFSIMAITDDGGTSWQFSKPLVGFENIQASITIKQNGNLVAYMRDNGPPPQRMQMSVSQDQGMTWGPVRDSELLNPGSGADVVTLQNGHWLMAYNDTEEGRNSLAVSLSEDEGKTWPYTKHLHKDPREKPFASTGAYPAIIQGTDGTIHVCYSFVQKDEQGKNLETIRYARFIEDWMRN